MKTLKFTGPYAELKNLGFKFHSLYARNYRMWMREFPGCHSISVWRKGNEVEIDDHYGLSGAVADFMLHNDPADMTSPGSRKLFPKGLIVLRFTIDRLNKTAIPYDENKHLDMLYYLAEQGQLPEEKKAKLEPGLTHKEFYKRFRVVLYDPEMVEAVREMFQLGLISLEN